jgi:hypothetical protein
MKCKKCGEDMGGHHNGFCCKCAMLVDENGNNYDVGGCGTSEEDYDDYMDRCRQTMANNTPFKKLQNNGYLEGIC